MNVLITGGYGLVGTALQKFVQNQNNFNFVFLNRSMGDLRDYKSVLDVFELYKPDIVVHLASYVGGVYENNDNNYSFLMDNMKINMNIIDACKKYKINKLINMLSTCIFPDSGLEYPLTTEQMFNGLPHFSNIGYSYSKRMLHVMSKILSDTTTTVVNIIPTNLYGINDNYNLKSGHVIPAMIHNVYNSINESNIIRIKGSGKALRQFLLVDDLAKIIFHFIIKNNCDKFIELIASPPMSHEISIKDLCSKIAGIFETNLDIVYDTTFIDGQYRKTTSDTDIQKYIPSFKFTKLDDGLKYVIDNFKENYSKIDRK